MKSETFFLHRPKVITGIPGMKRETLDLKITTSKSYPHGREVVIALTLHAMREDGETRASMSVEMTEDEAKSLRDSIDKMIRHRPS